MINKKKKLDVIIPLYDEEASLIPFHKRLMDVLVKTGYDFKILYVDDGSTDQTPELLLKLAQNDSRITVAQLSRNFGHQSALSAGLDLADGDIIITMDGDGQHPPEFIPILLSKYLEGFEIVQSQRQDSVNASFFKKNHPDFFTG